MRAANGPNSGEFGYRAKFGDLRIRPAMQPAALHAILDEPAQAERWLARCGVQDTRRGHGNLVRMATAGITLDLLADIAGQLEEQLPRLPDADMALNNLDRFVAASRNPLSLASLFERDRDALP